MARLSDVRSRLAAFPDVVEQLVTLREEMEYVSEESPHATLVRLWCTYGAHAKRYLPLSLAPILDQSLITAGVAVGWHSAPLPTSAPAHLTDYANRLLMGRLIHLTKQYDEPMWSQDIQDIQAIGSLAAYALASTKFGRKVDVIVSVPSSRLTNTLPFQLARDVAFLTGVRYGPPDTVTYGRHVSQVKNVGDYWEKRELLHAAMEARTEVVQDRHVVLVDDVCRSGATIHECARACLRAGASSVTVLAISKTFEFQRIPLPTARSWRRVPVLAEEIR